MARGRGRRTDYVWANFGDRENAQDLSSVAGIFGSTGFTFTVAGTLTRVRGRIAVTLDPAAVDEHAMILAGLMIVSADGFSAGNAPEIFTGFADEASWVWQGQLYVSSGAEAAIVTDQLSTELVVDTKAMRKVKPGQTLALVFQTPAELVLDQAGTFDLTYFFHLLVGE